MDVTHAMMEKKGVLLINLGTPDDYTPGAVYRYLTQFLNDPRVVDLPCIIRWLLVNGIIVPFRYRRSIAAYQKIWTDAGSPLLVNSNALVQSIAEELGPYFQVELGMRYGKPSIESALRKLADLQEIIVIPLFPQYSSAATGSAIEAVLSALQHRRNIPSVSLKNHFYDHPAFIAAIVAILREKLHHKKMDKIIFSYHGLPERQNIHQPMNYCYRTQCYETSRLVAKAMGLDKTDYEVAFQSRLGKTQWIKPYLDDLLPQLIDNNQKNIAIVCPSFVSDCLETLEEVNIRAREQWQLLGGQELICIPCVNDHPIWVKGLAESIKHG